MNRKEIRHQMLSAHTLEECLEAEAALTSYLEAHPDDWDLRDEAESLVMRRTALERLKANISATIPADSVVHVS